MREDPYGNKSGFFFSLLLFGDFLLFLFDFISFVGVEVIDDFAEEEVELLLCPIDLGGVDEEVVILAVLFYSWLF